MSGSRPDFVMVGGQEGDKFVLIASTSLTDVELREEHDLQRRWYGDRIGHVHTRRFLTAEMREWVVVVADSYAEAFRTLFEEWSPEPAPRPELDGLRSVTQRARNTAYHELGIEPPDEPRAITR